MAYRWSETNRHNRRNVDRPIAARSSLRVGGGIRCIVARLSPRGYSSFERFIDMPVGIDLDKVEAQFANGVLTVELVT